MLKAMEKIKATVAIIYAMVSGSTATSGRLGKAIIMVIKSKVNITKTINDLFTRVLQYFT